MKDDEIHAATCLLSDLRRAIEQCELAFENRDLEFAQAGCDIAADAVGDFRQRVPEESC